LLATAATLFWLGGCGGVGFIAQAVQGPPKTKALFVPEKEPTVVIVENYKAGGSANAVDNDMLANLLTTELERHEVVPVISPDKLTALRNKDPKAYRSKSIAELARAVGAKQVLYVDLVSAEVDDGVLGTNTTTSKVDARVKWVSASTAETLWPSDPADGFAVVFKSAPVFLGDGTSMARARSDMHRSAAQVVSQLFFTHLTESGTRSEE
jgi:hypothetical protein